MKYYVLDPEVAGGLGPHTILEEAKARPLHVIKLHYEFSGCLGDPILETVGCFIVTEGLKQGIEALQPTGITFEYVEVSKSEEFLDFYPDRELPSFVWLQITGKAGKDDFGLSTSNQLVVSQRIYDAIKGAGTQHCDVAPFQAEE